MWCCYSLHRADVLACLSSRTRCHCVTTLGAGTTQLKIDQLRHRQLPPAAAIGYPHTLSAPLLHVPFRRTSFGKRSFSTAAPSVWNSLPVSVQNCDTLTLFKSRLKAHLFSSVYASVLNITVLFASAFEATATWRFTNFVLYCTHGDTHGYGDRNSVPCTAALPCRAPDTVIRRWNSVL